MEPENNYCRKCQQTLPIKEFFESVDGGYVDANGYMSVCKNCINELYDIEYEDTKSMEKSIHKLCKALNIRYSKDAVDATKSHIKTNLDKGRNVNVIFSIYKMKLTATIKDMDKTKKTPMMYEDAGSIYVTEELNSDQLMIPEELKNFWGNWWHRDDVEFLENQYMNFKKTHKADTQAEIVLLKEVCYTMLKIQKLRQSNDETKNEVKELQEIMKNLAISPNAAAAISGNGRGMDTFGLWIKDIEKDEPAEWMKGDPRGDIYRDIDSVDDYFSKYIVRPLKNFILQSKDFNIDDEDNLFDGDDDELSVIDDGE